MLVWGGGEPLPSALVGSASVHVWKAAWHIPKSQMHTPSDPVIPLNHHPTNTPTRAKFLLAHLLQQCGYSRRLGSKTCPSFGNWFRNKASHARETKAGRWCPAAPAGGIFCQAWAGCRGTDLPGMGSAPQDSEPAGSRTGTPRTKATDPRQVRAESLGARPGWGRGLRGKLIVGSRGGHSRNGSCLSRSQAEGHSG